MSAWLWCVYKGQRLFITYVCIFQAEKTGQDPKEATEVQLYMQLPPIEKMDASLSTLANCEWVSHSEVVATVYIGMAMDGSALQPYWIGKNIMQGDKYSFHLHLNEDVTISQMNFFPESA